MLVDDSGVSRALMARWLTEAGAEIVATAGNGVEARERIGAADPDIVLLDIEMPQLGGLDVLPDLIDRAPDARILMVSTLSKRGARITMDALRLGATDAIAKPSGGWAGTAAPAFREELVRKVLILGGVRGRNSAPTKTPPAGPVSSTLARAPAAVLAKRRRAGIVVIGASTGGPNALFTLLGDLPPRPGAPILIAQHMPPMFTAILADHISRLTGHAATEGKDGEPLRPGHIYVAPGGRHMLVRRAPQGAEAIGHIALSDAAPENFCRPSVNPLFRSAAEWWGGEALGIVLTGMGTDGLEGAHALAARNARILVQDAESSVVWGMPGAVAKAKLAEGVLPLTGLAAELSAALVPA